MTTPPVPNVFHTLGVRPVINACGIYTDLGGSLLSPAVMAAWFELNQSWVQMTELLDRTGERIAELLAVPAARITPGASAAIALAVGACVAGGDPTKWDQLPDVRGLKREVLFQSRQLSRYKYSVCARLAGVSLKTAGTDQGTTLEEFTRAVGPHTAAIFYPAHLEDATTGLTLEQVASVARANSVPVIVDAAYMNFPVVPDHTGTDFAGVARTLMGSFFRRGADLVCFSAKYFWGPNAGGFVCGREDLIQIVAGLDFTRFESGVHKPFGRVFKMGRFEVAATALALDEWLSMDHGARLQTYRRQVERVATRLRGVPDISYRPAYFTMDERWVDGPVNCLVIDFQVDSATTIAAVQANLFNRTPRIMPFIDGNRLTVVMESVREGEELTIAEALLDALRGNA